MDRARFHPLEASAHKTLCLTRAGARKTQGNLTSLLPQRGEPASAAELGFSSFFFFFLCGKHIIRGIWTRQGDLLQLLRKAMRKLERLRIFRADGVNFIVNNPCSILARDWLLGGDPFAS